MDDLQQIKKLAGITPANSANMQPYDPTSGSNISLTGMEKADYQKEKDIRPGTPEWFRLWFALPLMTGEKPY